MIRENECVVSATNLYEGLTTTSRSFKIHGDSEINAFVERGRQLGFQFRDEVRVPNGRRVMVALAPRGLTADAESALINRWFASLDNTQPNPDNHDTANVRN